MLGRAAIRERLRHRARETGDTGFTLVEMAVAMLVFGIFLALTMTVAWSMQKSSATVTVRSDMNQQARLAVENIDRQVRSGNILYDPATETPAGFKMRVYTQSNGDQKCVEWRVTDQGYLQTRSWKSPILSDSDVTPWHTIITRVANEPGTPPFSLAPGIDFGGRLLNVHLEIGSNSDSSRDAEIRSAVAGRNTSYGYDTSICATPPAGG